MLRVVSCELAFMVVEPAEVVIQVVAAGSAGRVGGQRLDIVAGGKPPTSIEELDGPDTSRLHVVHAEPGRLTVSYRGEIEAPDQAEIEPPDRAEIEAGSGPGDRRPGHRSTSAFDRQVYMRPSRYCPSDHLVGFAVAEFGAGPPVQARVAAIAAWIRQRIGYVPGSSRVHDSAEDTLLTGMGTCRDFAHLGIALCRATGIPARFAAVYAPGLWPMDFHAVFEALDDGRWYVYDATGLAPRPSLVRVATGRDAADTAFASITSGIADLTSVLVTATVSPALPVDNQLGPVQLA